MNIVFKPERSNKNTVLRKVICADKLPLLTSSFCFSLPKIQKTMLLSMIVAQPYEKLAFESKLSFNHLDFSDRMQNIIHHTWWICYYGRRYFQVLWFCQLNWFFAILSLDLLTCKYRISPL